YDEVVLVVAGGGDHDVAGVEADALQLEWLAGVGVDPRAGHLARVPTDHVGVLLQDDDLVAVLDEVGGDVLADFAGTGDGDLHTLATFIPWRPSYLEGLAPAGQMLGKPAQLRPHDDEVQEVPL